MIAIVDYGLGNIPAYMDIYKSLGLSAMPAKSPQDLLSAKKIILPGVGSFDWAVSLLNRSGMRETLDLLVLEKKIPVLGVCVGMQIMCDSSEEGSESGLSWLAGSVKKLKTSGKHPLPHMGWNKVVSIGDNLLFEDLPSDWFYFLHSFSVNMANQEATSAKATYCDEFTCAINCENIFATQFHPEKSHAAGVKLLRNFAEI